MASFVIVLALSTPASADQKNKVYNLAGDWAQWNATTNNLTVCDHSSGNGTAKAVLRIINGTTKTLFDDNGNGGGCGFDGNLNVDETKSAYLKVCANGSGIDCWETPPFDL
jgi:uncharacterized protein YxeA